MREAHVNKPGGRNYSKVFAASLRKYGFENIDSGDRTRLFEVMTNISAIEKWRTTLPLNQRLALNHPSTVLRRWKSASTVPTPNAPPKISAFTKLKETNIELQEKLYSAERELSRGGDLWTPNDTADDIATVMVVKLSPIKAESVARTILQKLGVNAKNNNKQIMRAAVVEQIKSTSARISV